MFDKRIDERIRKPRRTKGTPFYTQRNYWALGVLACSGLSWYLFEKTRAAKEIRKLQTEGDFFDTPEGFKLKVKHIQAGFTSAPIDELLIKARERE